MHSRIWALDQARDGMKIVLLNDSEQSLNIFFSLFLNFYFFLNGVNNGHKQY